MFIYALARLKLSRSKNKVNLWTNLLKIPLFMPSKYPLDLRLRPTYGRSNTVISVFSHSVFKRFVLQTCKNQGLFGKALKNNEIEERSKFITFVDGKINYTQILKFVSWKVDNFVGKEKKLHTSIFLLSQQLFQKVSFSGPLKVRFVK